ncbi:MAG: SufS family cysteine desulfurase [Acidimicrobiales bacterium]
MTATPAPPTAPRSLDVAAVKADFPLLAQTAHGRPIVYLDSAATSQKPRSVLDAMTEYYETINANVHRGAYRIADLATQAMEAGRAKVARFVGADAPGEVVFTRNATEAINLVAHTWARANLRAGDAVVLSHMEHHSNIVPWQMLAAERGVEIRWLPITADYQLGLDQLDRTLDGAKLLAVTAMSNVLGTLTPVRELADAAHRAGALICVDACQHVPHLPTDVKAWDADFVAFSAHKMCGPTGIGALWGRAELLDAMPPFLGGGSMIGNVTLEGFTTAAVPQKFEAGTPPIAEAIGFGAACDYLSALGMEAVRAHEVALTGYALRTLHTRYGDDLTVYGPSEPGMRGGVLAFQYKDVHAHDVSQVLDGEGICVRAGHHCAKPLLRVLGAVSLARASLYLYNDEADVDALADAIAQIDKYFAD